VPRDRGRHRRQPQRRHRQDLPPQFDPRQGANARLRQLLIKIVPSELEPEPFIEAEPIHNGHTCSLFELSKETCRWPISTPGADDFCFCGNPPIEGLPYCAGHSRLAYRVAGVR
jgi:GcrA cell cycle regulator